jgi:predicted TIM-barrel fold metal-dependent hydrolase
MTVAGRTIVDAQAHLWKAESADWQWVPGRKPQLPEPFRIDKLVPMMDEAGVDRAVIVPPSWPGDRNDYAIDEVVKLAKYPNVSVKVSATVNSSMEPYSFRDMAEHIERCFDAYGPKRCYWGTDLTNSLAKATYRERITHFTEELPFLSEEDKDWVMGKAILQRLNWT